MQTLKWHEALVASGSADSDEIFAQEQCLEDWLGNKKFQVIEFDKDTYQALLEQAQCQGVEVVIIKEKQNDKP